MKKYSILNKLGLTSKEQGVYISLLEFGQSTVSQISRNTGLYRPAIYNALPKLLSFEIITKKIKGKTMYYEAENPKSLKNLILELKEELSENIPTLEKMYTGSKDKGNFAIKLFEGKKGLNKVFEDIVMSLKKGETYYRYSSRSNVYYKKDSFLSKKYHKMKKEKKIKTLIITNRDIEAAQTLSIFTETKVLPEIIGMFNYNITQVIYANKIGYLDYTREKAVVIENKELYRMQKSLFKTIYKKI